MVNGPAARYSLFAIRALKAGELARIRLNNNGFAMLEKYRVQNQRRSAVNDRK
jgi:hypothetical protein